MKIKIINNFIADEKTLNAKTFKKTKIKFNQLYIIASRMNFLKIIIEIDETRTL